MSVTILPYIDEKTTSAIADQIKTVQQPQQQPVSTENMVETFQDVLANIQRTSQAMAVDALLLAQSTGAVSSETVQKLLGFNPLTGETINRTTEASGTQTASQNSGVSCPDNLESYFKEASEKYNVDINLLKAIAKAESNFNAKAVSSAGAMGIMQLMPSTAKSLGVSNAYNAYENIMGGAKLIASNLKKYNGDVSLALAAYNAGGGNVDKYGGIPPFKETQNYVKKVLNYYKNGV